MVTVRGVVMRSVFRGNMLADECMYAYIYIYIYIIIGARNWTMILNSFLHVVALPYEAAVGGFLVSSCHVTSNRRRVRCVDLLHVQSIYIYTPYLTGRLCYAFRCLLGTERMKIIRWHVPNRKSGCRA